MLHTVVHLIKRHTIFILNIDFITTLMESMFGDINKRQWLYHGCPITRSWQPVGRFSHDLITVRKGKHEHRIVSPVWDFDCLHFAQYVSISPHGIGCKQTWCKKIIRMNRATSISPTKSVSFWIITFNINNNL